jgi:hypothetical protein
MYVFTDSVYDFALCNGSAWTYYCDGHAMADPTALTWTWTNQGGASVSSTYGGIHLSSTGTGSDQLRVYTVPLTTNTFDFLYVPLLTTGGAAPSVGIALRESGTGKLVLASIQAVSTEGKLIVEEWSSPTAYSAGVLATDAVPFVGTPIWVRVVESGTAFSIYFSKNGSYWSPAMVTQNNNTFFTTAPNQIGIFLNYNTGNTGSAAMAALTLKSAYIH